MNDISGIRRRVWLNGKEVTHAISNQDPHTLNRTRPHPEETSTITTEFTLLASQLGGGDAIDPLITPNLVGLYHLIETQIELPRGSGIYVDPPFGRRLRVQSFEPALEGFVEDAFVVEKLRVAGIDRLSFTRLPGVANDASDIAVGGGTSFRDVIDAYLRSIGLSLHVEPGDPEPSGTFGIPIVYQARGEATLDFLARLLSSNPDADGNMYGLWVDNLERIRIFEMKTTDLTTPWLNATRTRLFPGTLIPGGRPATGAKERLPGLIVATSTVDVFTTRANPPVVTTISRNANNNQILARTVEQTTYGGGANGGDRTTKEEERIRKFAIADFDETADTGGDTLIDAKTETIDVEYNVFNQEVKTTTTVELPEANFIEGSTSESLEVSQILEVSSEYTNGGTLLERRHKTIKTNGLLRREYQGNPRARQVPLGDQGLSTEQERIERWHYNGRDWVHTENTYHYFLPQQYAGTTSVSGAGTTPPRANTRPSSLIVTQRQLDQVFVINYGDTITIENPVNVTGTGTFIGNATVSGSYSFESGGVVQTGTGTISGQGTFAFAGTITGSGIFTGTNRLLGVVFENFESFPRNETNLSRAAQLSANFRLGQFFAWDLQVKLEDAVAEHPPGQPLHMARTGDRTFIFFAGDETLDFEETRTILGIKGLYAGQIVGGVYQNGLNLSTQPVLNVLGTDTGDEIVTDTGEPILISP